MSFKMRWVDLFESTNCRDMIGDFADKRISWSELNEWLSGYISDDGYTPNKDDLNMMNDIKMLRKLVRIYGVAKSINLAFRALERLQGYPNG